MDWQSEEEENTIIIPYQHQPESSLLEENMHFLDAKKEMNVMDVKKGIIPQKLKKEKNVKEIKKCFNGIVPKNAEARKVTTISKDTKKTSIPNVNLKKSSPVSSTTPPIKPIYVRHSLNEDPNLWPKVVLSRHLNDLLYNIGRNKADK